MKTRLTKWAEIFANDKTDIKLLVKIYTQRIQLSIEKKPLSVHLNSFFSFHLYH